MLKKKIKISSLFYLGEKIAFLFISCPFFPLCHFVRFYQFFLQINSIKKLFFLNIHFLKQLKKLKIYKKIKLISKSKIEKNH